jgi:hypothetical protein
MRRATAITVTALAALCVQCEELRVDEGEVCFVPANCPCPEPDRGTCYHDCPDGEFPADTSFRAVATFWEECDVPDNFECSVTQTGDFELTLHSSWRPPSSRPPSSECAASLSFTMDCGETPTLAAGTWTVNYGTNVHEFEVPSETASPSNVDPPPNCFYGTTTGE